MKKHPGVVIGIVSYLVIACSAQAAIPLPTAWWNFDNEEGETQATYDGIVPDKGSHGIDFYVNNYRGRSDFPILTFEADVSLYPAPEHYVPSGATFSGADSAYHLEGGIGYTYDDGFGNPLLDHDLDPRTTPILRADKYIYSHRDWLLPHPSDTGTVLDSTGGPNGGTLTYSFWLNVQAATRSVDGDRFGSDTSFLIGRGSGDADGYSGEVSIRKVGGSGLLPVYALQVRNERLFDGTLVPNATSIQDSSVLGITTLKDQWHHYVVQYDMTGATGSVTIWQDGGTVNGGLQGTLVGLGTRPITGDFFLNQVGHPGLSLKESGDFFLDDLAVWSGVLLDDDDVSALYNSGIAAAVPEPSSFALALLALPLFSLLLLRRSGRHARS